MGDKGRGKECRACQGFPTAQRESSHGKPGTVVTTSTHTCGDRGKSTESSRPAWARLCLENKRNSLLFKLSCYVPKLYQWWPSKLLLSAGSFLEMTKGALLPSVSSVSTLWLHCSSGHLWNCCPFTVNPLPYPAGCANPWLIYPSCLSLNTPRSHIGVNNHHLRMGTLPNFF